MSFSHRSSLYWTDLALLRIARERPFYPLNPLVTIPYISSLVHINIRETNVVPTVHVHSVSR